MEPPPGAASAGRLDDGIERWRRWGAVAGCCGGKLSLGRGMGGGRQILSALKGSSRRPVPPKMIVF